MSAIGQAFATGRPFATLRELTTGSPPAARREPTTL